MSKQAGNLIGVAAVLGVGYLAYKNGVFASVVKLISPPGSQNNPINVPTGYKFNAGNNALKDALDASQIKQDGVALANALALTPSPLVVLAPAAADDLGSWSQRDGNYEPGNYQ